MWLARANGVLWHAPSNISGAMSQIFTTGLAELIAPRRRESGTGAAQKTTSLRCDARKRPAVHTRPFLTSRFFPAPSFRPSTPSRHTYIFGSMVADDRARGRLLILYGSQTGCAEEVGNNLAAEAARQCFAPQCCSMEDFDVRQLPSEELIVFVVSTAGEGEVPDGMRAFWQFLLRRDLPQQSLASLRHACFGLGDSSYPKFCYAAKRLHRRLTQLGSVPVVALGLGDDQDALGVEQALAPWSQQLWTELGTRMPLPDGANVLPKGACPPPRYRVTYLEQAPETTAVGFQHAHSSIHALQAPADRRRPYRARVLNNRLLTKEGCGREVRHIELNVSHWGLHYAPGDALAVQPLNPEAATRALLATLGLVERAPIRIERDQHHAPELHWQGHGDGGRGTPDTVLDLFSRRLDVFGVPRRSFFALLSHFASDPEQKERLQEFGSDAGGPDLLEYATRPRRTYAEVLLEFPSARPPLAYYLDLIPPLRERYFSIASSPTLHPSCVHIAVAVVRYQTRLQLPRFGVCSTYLASLRAASDGTEGDSVGVWLRQGCLRLPASPSAPLVMIGPGTGVAPFRAFVQARQTQLAAFAESSLIAGREDVGDATLFFGCRRAEHDYLYADEWQAHLERGDLRHLHAAFSREPGLPKVCRVCPRATPCALRSRMAT